MKRLKHMLDALTEHVNPQVLDRLGVRYIDRVTGGNLRDLPKLVRPEVAGVLGSPLSKLTEHSLSSNVWTLPGNAGHAVVRWGLLEPRGTIDPGVLDALDVPSWILDSDVFQAFPSGDRLLDTNSVVGQARGFAERAYGIFRWAVTDEFLRRYGGDP